MENEKEITRITDAFNQLNFDSSQKLDNTKDSYGNYLYDMNNSNGMYQVGYCYYLGIGVEIDKHKAFTYYLKSAEADNSMGIWKTVWCYYYGIGVEKNDDKWWEWYKKQSEYGKCVHCNEDNTQPAWCLSCDPDIATRWTIGNKNIDDCMKTFQLRDRKYEDVIEWIPFDKLSGVKIIGKGGFGSVYSATWLDGIRKVETIKDDDNDIYKKKNFCDLTWQAKLEILKNISAELYSIHERAGYIHADFHSGNILQDQGSYIADLGLSRKTDEKVLEGDIYGVMPYVAPEVLLGEQQFTKATDIYGFGVIMSEMTTGQRPFDGHKFDTKLAVKICKGLQPEFAPETPKCYIELAKKCMNSDPQERPVSSNIYCEIKDWLEKIANSDDDNEIKKQFLEADKVIKSLPISKHSDEMYTSKIISTKSISKAIKNLSQADSVQIDLDITKKNLKILYVHN
ncbi:kinase-like domain-containing protein [Gigaspora rosea]|uniref:Kinase-like domain-containing protein n=1 Tax=Gigaspora rosea TaxID=44941 RepID=A0A397W835_9GLOM|nr:kinase-like domain-containing protein [Gigaspora rosea]